MPWHFGPFRLDLTNASLWQAEQPVPLRPKTFALLAYLAAHAGQLVTKEALLDAVWPETAVGEVVAQYQPPEVAQAKTYYRQALALAEELGMRPLQAHCHRDLGTLYLALGQGEQACTALSTAMALYRTMDMTFWLPQVEAALAQVKEERQRG